MERVLHSLRSMALRDALDWIQTVWLGVLLLLAVGWWGGVVGEAKVALSLGLAVSWGLLVWRSLLPEPGGGGGGWPWLGALWLPFLACGAWSAWGQSPVVWRGVQEWALWLMGWVVMVAVLRQVRTGAQLWTLLGLLAGGGVVVNLCAYQQLREEAWLPWGGVLAEQYWGRVSGSFFSPNHFAGLMLLVFFPMLVVACWRGVPLALRVLAGYLAVVFALGVGLSVSRGGVLALVAGVILVPLLVVRARRGWLVAAGVGGLLVGLVLVLALSGDVRGRFERVFAQRGEVSRAVIWAVAWEGVKQAPILGTGAASFDVEFESGRPAGFDRRPVWVHNEYLNLLLDYGVVGTVLFLMPAGWLLLRSLGRWRRLPWAVRGEGLERRVGMEKLLLAAVLPAVLAVGVHACVDFHFRIPGVWLPFCAYVGILGVVGLRQSLWTTPGASLWRGLVVGGLLIGCGAWAGVEGTRIFVAEAWHGRLRQELDTYRRDGRVLRGEVEHLEPLEAGLRRVVRWEPRHAAALGDLALVIFLRQYGATPEEGRRLGAESELWARRAIAAAPRLYEPWLYLGYAQWAQGKREDSLASFERATHLAPASHQCWYELGKFLYASGKRQEAEAALLQSLALSSWRRETHALLREVRSGTR